MTKIHNLYGLTICQAGAELRHILRERGISDLNARIITKKNPAACFKALSAGLADIAMMPLSTGERLAEDTAKYPDVTHIPQLDHALTLHAIGQRGSTRSMLDMEALNLGLANLKSSGAWLAIAKEFFRGHDHDAKYDEAHSH
jgi:hypothetical protein